MVLFVGYDCDSSNSDRIIGTATATVTATAT